MYNPETYDWYQCDEEDYNSNDSPEEQAEALRARQDYAKQLIAAIRAAVTQVPPYRSQYQREAALDLSHEESETDILRERIALDNPAYATADEVRMADLYDM